jgi:hypothetical protein
MSAAGAAQENRERRASSAARANLRAGVRFAPIGAGATRSDEFCRGNPVEQKSLLGISRICPEFLD